MIGVVVNPKELDVAEEFFQLFKTPWERAVTGRRYHVVLSTDGIPDNLDAALFLVYGSGEQGVDNQAGFPVKLLNGPLDIEWRDWTFPVYGAVGVFEREGHEGSLKAGNKTIDCQYEAGGRVFRRIGYDLFAEIRYLLTQGQPPSQALIPTLELHIALVRHLLIESNIPFLEIPPQPYGYNFICCLTHDVDFFGIRRHKFDRTLAGFLYRASIGSLIDFIQGRRPLAEVAENWLAILSLPLVFLRLMPDLWRPFEHYAHVENTRQSTFFLIPFKGRPGLAPGGALNASRSAPYGADEIQSEVQQAARRGSEIGVHGIDAWCDTHAGAEEMKQLNGITGQKAVGIRMHWLYFDADSPKRLEQAGFDYDSSSGYNEVVGYRPGTSQVFRPLGNETLLELPMCIMDSALLSSGRMGLASQEAMELCRRIIANARNFGGTLVINWHDRSLAPERQWGMFYKDLLKEVDDGTWFAKAGEAVEWFRWRRSIRFQESSDVSNIRVSAPYTSSQYAIIRICRPGLDGSEVRDAVFDGIQPIEVLA